MKVDLRVTPLGAGGEYYIKGTIELPEELVELLKRLAYPPTMPAIVPEGSTIIFPE